MKPSYRACLLLLLTLALVLAACAPRSEVRPNDFESLAAALDADMPGLLKAYRVPGATVALVADGKLSWSQGYGLADKENDVPANNDTVYQIASISKTMAAWGVMRLVEQGQIDLDAPAIDYLYRWQIPDSSYNIEGVTVRRLLSHSAGLNVHGYAGYSPDDPLPSLEDSLSGLAEDTDPVQLFTEPGSTFSYSGGGYTILQLIVEEVSGLPFADFMQYEVFDPLGLEQTSYYWREDLQPMTAKAYDANGRLLPNYLFIEQAAAGVYTTAPELAEFGAAYLTGGGVLSRDSIAEMSQVAAPIDPSSFEGYLSGMDGYGLGVFVETLPDGTQTISHTGGNQGWRSLMVIVPSRRAALVVLTNSDSGSGLYEAVRARWADWLGAGTPVGIQHATLLTILIVAASLLLLLGFAWWLYNFAQAYTAGRRRFALPDLGRGSGWGRALGLLAALLLIAAWIFLGALIVGSLFPLQSWLVGLAFIAWVLALVIGMLTEKVRP